VEFDNQRGKLPFDNSLDRAVEQVVDYMLFADEAPLRDPVKGTSTFTETFLSADYATKRAALCATLICRIGCSAILSRT
jgi:hypothetical protein